MTDDKTQGPITHAAARDIVASTLRSMPSWRRDLDRYIDQQEAKEAQLAEATAKLEAAERWNLEFEQWLQRQADFFEQNPQVNQTFLDVLGKLRGETVDEAPEPVAATVEPPQRPGGMGPDSALRQQLIDALRAEDGRPGWEAFRRVAERLERAGDSH